RLRQRLRDTGKAPRLIQTVRGSGYLLAGRGGAPPPPRGKGGGGGPGGARRGGGAGRGPAPPLPPLVEAVRAAGH
ncbi:winged helix-turn-helix domain-containing protein, partial [Pseudomonas aeruginosa]|uniref:winged helix-turn-helix domain-containing protein n=1 Tax=Pseudomonas aeruginosa TaxID=287 RepID=UPI001F28547D